MKTLTADVKAELMRDYEAQTTGSEKIHRHPLGILYTDGMLYLAETCGAHWLLDLVASHQPAIRRNHPRLVDFQVWQLRPEGEGWTAQAWSDTPEEKGSTLLVRQDFEYSDFPISLCPFLFYVANNTALLRGEY